MTNPIIPYSFVPGTKAKAQEINANFVSVADRIQSDKDFVNQKVLDIETAIDLNNTNTSTQLAEINELLETKANTDASNAAVASKTEKGVTQFGTSTADVAETRPAVVIKTYLSGSTWYRLWSDNWVEQGGVAGASNTVDTDITITFPKKFSSTNYYFNYSALTATTYTTSYYPHIDVGSYMAVTATYMRLRLRSFYKRAIWYACGYAAE